MDRYEIIQELKGVIGDYLGKCGLDLVDLTYRYEGRNLFLRVLLDKPEGGISLDDCAQLNNEISVILDEKNILKERYILEVSSPGLDRSLIEKKDFLRCIDREVKIFLKEPMGGKTEIDGLLIKVEEDTVGVDTASGIMYIPLAKINKAKQIIKIN